MEIHHQIRNLRERKKITQKELSEFIGINQNTYHLIETGASALKVDHYLLICRKLDVDPLTLLESEINHYFIPDSILESNNSHIIHLNELYYDQKAIVDLLGKQLQIKDEQIERKDILVKTLINLIPKIV